MSTADLPLMPNAAAELLSVPEVRQRVHQLSVERYHELSATGLIEEKTELIRGVVIEKMTKSPDHSWMSDFLAAWLRDSLPSGWCVRHEQPMTFKDSEPEPDVAVVEGGMDDYRRAHPKRAALVIEVAVTSEKLDREKAALYAEAGIGEYWIVLAGQQAVEVCRQPRGGRYTEIGLLGVGQTLEPAAFAGLQLPVAALFPPEG